MATVTGRRLWMRPRPPWHPCQLAKRTRCYNAPRALTDQSSTLPYFLGPSQSGHRHRHGCLLDRSPMPLPLPTYQCRLQSTVKQCNDEHAVEEPTTLPPTIHLDFFGEPVTFLPSGGGAAAPRQPASQVMAALDNFALAVVSKGQSCIGNRGGAPGEHRAPHAAAMAWTQLLGQVSSLSSLQSTSGYDVPMLAVTAVAPVVAQAGTHYVAYLDTLLAQTRPLAGQQNAVQLLELAHHAVAVLADESRRDLLQPRERWHLQALACLMNNEHDAALAVYNKLLQNCPGDVLALSLAMDIAHVVGDADAALRIAGSVTAYWNERRGGWITPSIPGQAMATGIMAVGLAVAGHVEEAERLAAQNSRSKFNGAWMAWAKAHVYDATGRVSEGISALANYDGMRLYEGCGWLHFDSRLAGYGARFCLDREERGRGKSAALRLYEEYFERILHDSGMALGRLPDKPHRKAPLNWTNTTPGEPAAAPGNTTFMKSFFKASNTNTADSDEIDAVDVVTGRDGVTGDLVTWTPQCEDVLTFLPPTPQFLTEATVLLLRATLNGTVSARNARWDALRSGWQALLKMDPSKEGMLSFYPLAAVTASLLVHKQTVYPGHMVSSGRLAHGLSLLGEQLHLGHVTAPSEATTAVREIIAESDPAFWLPVPADDREVWREILSHLTNDPFDAAGELHQRRSYHMSRNFACWQFDVRPILEHATVYVACKAGDTESLCLARSICSRGVTLRASSPEEWWRYSIVLGLLGDQVASEDALYRSINLGGGQGARG